MAKFLLFPVRLSVGWSLSPRVLSLLAALMLVVLRLTIGWHFYSEGIDKHHAGNWTAAPFFANARGPLSEHFREMVWDYDGQFRLNRDAVVATLAAHRDRVQNHFGFSEEQQGKAEKVFMGATNQYDWVIAENANDIEEFVLGRERIAKLATDSKEAKLREGVASLGGQRDTIRREWQGKAKATFAALEKLWTNYERQLNAVATDQQLAAQGPVSFRLPRTALMDTSVIDRIVPYFDIVTGLCLLLGLFTPVAALAAAAFLGSVFLSQFPPATGPGSSSYQLIEGMACLVLASTGAGRFAGLDFFLHLGVRKAVADSLIDDDDDD